VQIRYSMRTIPSVMLHWLSLFMAMKNSKGHNVAMTSSGIAVAATGIEGQGLILQQTASRQPAPQPLPQDIASFQDVSVDAGNERLVFALSTVSRRVCSFTISNAALSLQNCVGGRFAVAPFCGVSALDGTLIISGGTGGMTIYEYNPESGVISGSPSVLNRGLGAIGHPDVVLVDADLAALSTDFRGEPRFGTQIASIQGSSVNFVRDFRVRNSLRFNSILAPANFPLVNAIYKTNTNTYMYTANGPMQVQEPLSSDTPTTIGAPNGFSAVTVAVNTAKNIAVFGGLTDSGGSSILFYDLSVNPRKPTLVSNVPIRIQRITSIALGGDVAGYVTQQSPSIIQYESLPSVISGFSERSSVAIRTATPRTSSTSALYELNWYILSISMGLSLGALFL